jgi:SSS family solute:Na+ symporter
MLVVSMLVIMIVSRFTKAAPDSQLVGLTYASATSEQNADTRASWSKWDLIHTVIILGFTVAFYIYFW